MYEYVPGLIAALIWAYVVNVYRKIRLTFLTLNLYRLVCATLTALVLVLVVRCYTIAPDIVWPILNGLIVLGLGDTAYVRSLKLAGVVIATPVAYTYIVLMQLFAFLLGERITIVKVAASVLALLGIVLLSISKRERVESNVRYGVMWAFLTSLLWASGHSLLKLAVVNLDFLYITFLRLAAGLVIVALLVRLERENVIDQLRDVRLRDLVVLTVCSVVDIVLGAYLFIMSIALVGLSMTVILNAITPIAGQVIARLFYRERLTIWELTAGVLVSGGIVLSTVG